MSAFKYFMKSEWECVRVGATVNFSVGVKGTAGMKMNQELNVFAAHMASLCCVSDGRMRRSAVSHRNFR